MEQNADTGASVTLAVENKQKGGNGLKIATAIACIVAVCGIGFGVYGVMQSLQKDGRISDLEAQIDTVGQPTGAVDSEPWNYIYEGGYRIKLLESELPTHDEAFVGLDYASNSQGLYIWGAVVRAGEYDVWGGLMSVNDESSLIASPYLAKIYTDVYSGECSFGGEKIIGTEGRTLCYVETSDGVLIDYYGDDAMGSHIRPTLEVLRKHFMDVNNYIDIYSANSAS